METKGDGAKFENDNNLMKKKIEEDNRKRAAAVKAKYDMTEPSHIHIAVVGILRYYNMTFPPIVT